MAHPQDELDPPPVPIGSLVSNRYRILDVIGAGGMAFVLSARDQENDRIVALKILRAELAQFDVAKARFLREAGAAARIKSEYVAEVFDVGQTDEGLAFIVMEYLEGQTLEELMYERGALPVQEAVDFVLEALEALAHAHALGVVHRDIKPSNLFIARSPDGSLRVKILDFGISKANPLVSARRQLTIKNALLGSPAYMSPEQARSSTDVDQRTDLWSLGVILYELLAAKPPFEGETPVRLIVSISSNPPLPLRRFRPDVSEELEAVVLRCLERDLDRRFASAAELAHALAPFASERTKDLPEQIAKVSLEAFEPVAPRPNAEQAETPVEQALTPAEAPETSPAPKTPEHEVSDEPTKTPGTRRNTNAKNTKNTKRLPIATLILWAAFLLGLMMIARAAWKVSQALHQPPKPAPSSTNK